MVTVEEALANVDFRSFLQALYDGGWYHYIFPFMLVYAIVYTVLNYVDVFKDRKPVKVIIALVFGLFAVAFPITGEGDCFGCQKTLADFMMALFPGVTAFSIAILALYIVAATLGVDLNAFFGKNGTPWVRYVLGVLGLLFVGYYIANGFGWLDNFDGFFFEILRDPMLYILVIFGLFLWWLAKDDNDEYIFDEEGRRQRIPRENRNRREN